FDTTTGKHQKTVEVQQNGGIARIAYRPTGGECALMTSFGSFVQLWDPKTWKPLEETNSVGSVGGSSQHSAMAYSSDGKRFAAIGFLSGQPSGTRFRLWDKPQPKPRELWLEGYSVFSLAFAPDGKTIALGCEYIPRPAPGRGV